MLDDESMLLQAVINLLDNAVKFNPAGTTVMIDLKEQEDCFCLQVSDDGPGIPRSEQEQVFAKFHRGAHDGTEGGFGLRLNLVQQVVAAHGGTITLDRYAPEGALFRLVLPKKVIS